jgi:uncharacterized membrane protein
VSAHPIHPAVVHFPLALLLTSTAADLAHLAGVWPEPRFAAWLVVWGLAGGLVAMAAGLFDFRRLNDRQVSHALRHMGTVAVAWIGYAIALYLRRDVLAGGAEPPLASVVVAVVSAAILGVGGWLGGELVYRYGAGRIEP